MKAAGHKHDEVLRPAACLEAGCCGPPPHRVVRGSRRLQAAPQRATRLRLGIAANLRDTRSMSAQARTFTPEQLLGTLNSVEQKNAPERLYLRGDESLLTKGARVAVVGSRQASSSALQRAASIARALVRRDIVVVSGLAEGIDTAAHRAAIANGGRTIAVLGTPLSRAFPASNRDLQLEIGERHLLVSQFAEGAPGGRKNFPIRNRTMALVTDATIVVTATEDSGTRHQAWEALRLGRELFLMETFVREGGVKWADEMLGYGAKVLSRENLDDLLALVPERVGGEELAF